MNHILAKILTTILIAFIPLMVSAENSFSTELLVGNANLKFNRKLTTKTSESHASIGIRGAYSLNQYVAFELEFQDLGETDHYYLELNRYTYRTKINTKIYNLGVKGIFPFDNGISLFGRVGLVSLDAKEAGTLSFDDTVFFLNNDRNGEHYYSAIGLQYNVNERFSIGGEYFTTEIDTSGRSDSFYKIRNISLSVAYKF